MGKPMKVLAQDADDLGILSACLQDAIVPVIDMAYLAAERQFLLVANRFRWEVLASADAEGALPVCAETGKPMHERVLCGVRFDNITAARVRGVDLRQRDEILNLLCVRREGDEILLLFSGGGMVALACTKLACVAQDVGHAWKTTCCPGHGVVCGEGDDAPLAAKPPQSTPTDTSLH